MEKFIQKVTTCLLRSNQFTVEQLEIVKATMAEIGRDYTIECAKNEVVTKDYFKPAGYEEFFADKIMCGMSDNTINMYKYAIDRFLLKVSKPIDKISSEDVALYLYTKRKQDGSSERYANNLRRYLSSFFTWLFTHEYIKKNPILNVKAIKEPVRSGDTLTTEQFEMLMRNAIRQRDKAILAVMAGSGLRRQEVCDMKLSDLDLEHSKFKIVGKGNKERTCFLTSRAKMELKLYLQQRKDDCEYVFVREWAPHTQLSKTGLGAVIKDIGDRAGMKVHPHMLRHYFADCAHGANIDVLDISRMMGHASISTTQIYIASNTDDLAYKHARIG